MSTEIPFSSNFSDLSNVDGYQFEFHCDRCGNGYRSAFQRDIAATGQKVARGLGSLLGDRFYGIASAADRFLDRSTNSEAKDRALAKAVAEISPHFQQCRGCGDWVCEDICWNSGVGQCVRCSPVASEELAQLQAQERGHQIRSRLQDVDLTKGLTLDRQAQPRCPSCGAQSTGGKFCNSCGSALALEVTCGSCSHNNPEGALYCAQCGSPLN